MPPEKSFPLPVTYDELPSNKEEAEATRAENAPFAIVQLAAALEATKKCTAPDVKHITLMMLWNLPEDHKAELLDVFNTFGSVSGIPVGLKLSIVNHGKPLKNTWNMRPILLTPKLCNTMEKMAVKRKTWLLEMHDKLHLMQTGSEASALIHE